MSVLVELQDELRSELKEPFGPIYTEADALLADAEEPIVAVGDVVTYHLVQGGRVPDVAFIDGRTKRSDVDDEILEGIEGFDHEVEVTNPAATVTSEVLIALRDALDGPEGERTLVVVEGEEDLVALPTILALSRGSVVYGQPDEGMVLVSLEEETIARIRDILTRMDGDSERVLELVDGGA